MYIPDHDLHIHSHLSACSNDPAQTPEAILAYAKANGLRKICLTDHFWDESVAGASGWYAPQNMAHIRKSLPLPSDTAVEFCFGCETEMDAKLQLGIAPETFDRFDFVIIPTTHLHMGNYTVPPDIQTMEDVAAWYVRRLEALLAMDLPFHKIGIAHLTTDLIAATWKKTRFQVLELIADQTFANLFAKAAEKGVGIELNFNSFANTGDEAESELRPFRLAKAQGCRFYFGSDAHGTTTLEKAMENFRNISAQLALSETDIFDFAKN